jgi:hypothetical protein
MSLPLLLSGLAALEDQAGRGYQHSQDLPRHCLPGETEMVRVSSWTSLHGGERERKGRGGEGRAHSLWPPLLLDAHALRSTTEDKRAGEAAMEPSHLHCRMGAAQPSPTRYSYQGLALGNPPGPRLPQPSPYPGTVVEAWHTGNTLVSLLSLHQEGC